jgi:hypothetical protein
MTLVALPLPRAAEWSITNGFLVASKKAVSAQERH